MKLKHLSLQGYKTFATRTDFIFEDAITAIVGPNGSGKSNVADAVRWVLGEQSYSTLRGKKTIDMIFAGSKTRARAGMAQAVLTLDNSGGWLPIDYAEVEICRRAYRSGENEYLLNGQKVRLMDINDLLARAGLAEQTYTIIGQGLIDQALSLKADERRALFEEAAGISHYKARRTTSLRKLQDTQHNLERVYDILSELRPRLNSLRRQAERAQTYAQLETDLRGLLRIWYGYQWEAAKKGLRARRQQAAESESGWQGAREKLLRKQDEIEQLREGLHDLEERHQTLQRERESVREDWERARREVAILRERQRALERQLAETAEDLPALEAQRAAAESELEGASAELRTVQLNLESQQLELNRFESAFQQKQTAIDEARQRVASLEARIRDGQTAIARIQGQLNQLAERLVEREASGSDETGTSDLQTEIDRLSAALEVAHAAVEALETERGARQDERRELERQIGDGRREIEQERRQLHQAQNQLARLQTRTEMLEHLRQKEAPEIDGVPLLGRLAQILTIPSDWQTPLEIALQSRLATQIVPDEKALWQLIGRRSPKQTLAAVSLDRLRAENPRPAGLDNQPGFVGLAHEIVSCPAEFRQVAATLLDHLVLVQDGATALHLAGELPNGYTAVSLDGIVAHASGLVELPRLDGRQGIMAQEEAWRQAAAELAAEKAAIERQDSRLAGRQEALKALFERLEAVNRERHRLGQQAEEAARRVTAAQRELDRAAQRQAIFQQQAEQRLAETARLQERRQQWQNEIAAGRDEQIRLEAELDQAREALASLPVGEAEQQRQTLSQQIAAVRSLVDGRRAIADSRRATLQQIDQQLVRLRGRRDEWSRQLGELALGEEEGKLQDLQRRMDEISADLDPLRADMRARQIDLRRLEGEAAAAQKITHDHESRYTQSRIALTQQETTIENLKERIRQDLGLVALRYDEEQTGDTPLPLTEVIDQLPAVEELPEDLEDSIQKFRGQLSRIGAINPEAPAEFEEVQTRYDFMIQQVEDLEQTEKQLRQVIAELDEMTSRAFAETVEKVNTVFGKMFTRLFGGGSAHLLLTDPDDLTITGVDIVAQLPGRRPQGLALLSGGERSLTASALIFALLKVAPTPFCVMDEVDAALDEANINRFREVLSELSEKTQFIVITHNRGTVQAAQAIYGITMGTDSTSQVISVKPEEYITQVELLH